MITHLWKGVKTEYEDMWSAGLPEKIEAREDGKIECGLKMVPRMLPKIDIFIKDKP